MQESSFLNHFINKTVDFRFQRQELKFHLSQSLFSSNDVDDGSKRLLKTIAQRLDLDRTSATLDVGCGVGVLGICLKKRYPEMDVTLQDRDALALAFTELNCRLNELGPATILGSLALQGIGKSKFDLIASNLPGKAGPPVLTDILSRIPDHLSETGVAAVVIVKPLAELVHHTLIENESEILFQETKGDHAVFHFRGGKLPPTSSDPQSAYQRGVHVFKAAGFAFEQTTVHNLAEFDTLSYQTRLAIRMVKDEKISGKVLLWNPGQGHLATILSLGHKDQISEYVLGSRDLLSLEISKLNLMAHGVAEDALTLVHAPHVLRIEDRYDFAAISPDIDPGVPWHRYLLRQCRDILVPGGRAMMVAKSGAMHRILTSNTDLVLEASRKRWGFRTIVLRAPEQSGAELSERC